MSISSRHKVDHSIVCGILPETDCPQCRAAREAEDLERSPGLRDDIAADWLVMTLGLPRRPRVLTRQEKFETLMAFLDIGLTMRRDLDFAASVRDAAADIFGPEVRR